jgi:hypothetical protein
MRSVRDSDANAKLWQKNRDIGKSLNSIAQATEQNTRQIAKLRRRMIGGGGNSFSLQCKLYGNPTTQGYTAGIFYKLLDTDFAVTDGYVCAGSSTPVKATAGKWLCLKDVPALKNDGSDLPNYLPTLPAASGSLDPDNALNYWEFFTPSQICVDGTPTSV